MTQAAACAPGFVWKRALTSAFALVLFVATSIAPARAQVQKKAAEFEIKSRQAILIDADTGAVLFAHNADEEMYPASMSKIMTLIMIFKALKAGTISSATEYIMSVHAWRTGGAPSRTSAMQVPVNTKERLEQLLQGIIVESGNDACIAVAEGLAGSESAFAGQMEEEARRIGLKRTTFRNATGLFHPEHKSTAREIALLGRYMVREFPEYYPMFAQREFLYRKHRFINRNPLLGLSIGVDGIKTGHLKESGYGMIASAKQGNRRLILVVNGLEKAEDRKNEAVKIFEWGFRTFIDVKLFEAGETVGQARVWGGSRMYVPLNGGANPISVLLPRFPANPRLKVDIVYPGPLKTPITRGQEVARLRVVTPDNAVNEVPLYAAEDVQSAGIMRRGLDTLVHYALRWVL